MHLFSKMILWWWNCMMIMLIIDDVIDCRGKGDVCWWKCEWWSENILEHLSLSSQPQLKPLAGEKPQSIADNRVFDFLLKLNQSAACCDHLKYFFFFLLQSIYLTQQYSEERHNARSPTYLACITPVFLMWRNKMLFL